MGKMTKYKEQILKESELETSLKEYLNKMSKFMGEDFTSLILSADKDIVESLNIFTNAFKDSNSDEITFILLRGAVLSNSKDYHVQVIKSNVSNGDLQDSLFLVNENMGFRKSLTRNLMNNSNVTDRELFNTLNDKETALQDLDTLIFYEHVLKEKEKELELLNK